MNSPHPATEVSASISAQISLEDLGGETPSPTPSVQTKSNHYSPGMSSGIEEKALNLLGSGIPAESVASALGVTPARIAQLLSTEQFSQAVAALRYENLQEHNERDSVYDSLEDKLLEKLEKSLPLMFKPQDVLNAIRVINGAKRRGQSSPEQVTNQQNIVNLVLPTAIAQKFSINIDNQVTRAGDQELHTMPASNLLKQVEDTRDQRTQNLLVEQDSEGNSACQSPLETALTEQEVQL